MTKEEDDELVCKVTSIIESLFCKKEGCLQFLRMRKIKDSEIWVLLDFALHPSRKTSSCITRGIWIDIHAASDYEHLVIVERTTEDKSLMDEVIERMEEGFRIEIR